MTQLSPDRLRAMARAWALIMRGPDVPDHPVVPTPLELRAAQACWEASPGGELMEAAALYFAVRDLGIVHSTDDQLREMNAAALRIRKVLRTEEALRQALPQGTET